MLCPKCNPTQTTQDINISLLEKFLRRDDAVKINTYRCSGCQSVFVLATVHKTGNPVYDTRPMFLEEARAIIKDYYASLYSYTPMEGVPEPLAEAFQGASRHGHGDPTAALFYLRRTLELLFEDTHHDRGRLAKKFDETLANNEHYQALETFLRTVQTAKNEEDIEENIYFYINAVYTLLQMRYVLPHELNQKEHELIAVSQKIAIGDLRTEADHPDQNKAPLLYQAKNKQENPY